MLLARLFNRRLALNAYRHIQSQSAYWSTVNSPAFGEFVNRISNQLLALKSGTNAASTSQTTSSSSVAYWQKIVDANAALQTTRDELEQLDQLAVDASSDRSMQSIIDGDRESLQTEFEEALNRLVASIVPVDRVDLLNKCQLEFSSGAGGVEAMLFTAELIAMYEQLCIDRGWQWTQLEFEIGAQGGARSALISICGKRAYSTLRFEAGVHRVQRVPVTDPTRIHTSTSSLSVLPEPEEAQVEISSADVKIEAMRASGPGGQNVNKRSSAIRLTHLPTGISVHVMDERFQHLNLKIAYQRLGAILLQQQVDETQSGRTAARRLQVGSKARAEKVRTFNFKDDRITDHRLRLSTSRIETFLAAGDNLNYFMDELDRLNTLERLNEIINSN